MTTHTDLSRDMAPVKMELGLTRAEWMAAASLVLSTLTMAYMAGVEVQRLNDHDRRIISLETSQDRMTAKIEEIRVTSARIDANVAALTDQARERRGAR